MYCGGVGEYRRDRKASQKTESATGFDQIIYVFDFFFFFSPAETFLVLIFVSLLLLKKQRPARDISGVKNGTNVTAHRVNRVFFF